MIRSSAIESGVVALGSRRADDGGDINEGAERGDETAVGWDGGGEAEAEVGPVAGEGRRPLRRASDSGTSVGGDEEADGEATGNEVCEPDRTSGESARNGTEPPFAGGSERASESGCREAEAIRARAPSLRSNQWANHAGRCQSRASKASHRWHRYRRRRNSMERVPR